MYCEILPNLFIADETAANRLQFYLDNNIKLIINCTCDIDFFKDDNCVTDKVRLAVNDKIVADNIVKLYRAFDKINNEIFKYLNSSKGVLVFCKCGKQRSVTVVVAYIMKHSKLDKDEAIRLIKTKHPRCFNPVINFYQSLTLYERDLRKST